MFAARSERGGRPDDRGAVRHDSLATDEWTTAGVAKVLRDVTTGRAEVRGVATVGGSFAAGSLELDGRLEVGGTVTVGEGLTGRGELIAGGTIRAGDVRLAGELRAVREVEVSRTLEIVGTGAAAALAAGALRVSGSLLVPGPVRAPRVELDLAAGSRIGTIAAEEVVLRGPRPSLVDRVLGRTPETFVERIEARRVRLSGVTVDRVRSPEIELGRGSRAVEVDGTVVRRAADARLGPVSHSPAPRGLWR